MNAGKQFQNIVSGLLRSIPIRLCGMGLLLTLTTGVAQAQTSSTVGGSVLDQTGAGVAGAQVTLKSLGTGAVRTVLTGMGGDYTIAQVPAGEYALIVEAKGFRRETREHIEVRVAAPTTVDFNLQVGAIGEEVTVQGNIETVNTQDASIGSNFDTEQITQLPFAARNPVNLLTLQPGVVFTGMSDTDLLSLGSTQALDPREGVVNGVLGNQSYVSLDGIESNDYQNQSAFTSVLPVTLDALQEFRVITTNATASSGAAGGAQVEMVTKSGTNQFHGNARWFNRDTSLAANSFFNNREDIPRAKLIRNIYGVSVGGPVLKDRVFFFLDYEGRTDRSGTPVTRVIPTNSLKAGNLYYTVASNGPGVIPCPNNAGQFCQELTPSQIKQLDPGCTQPGSAGCGVNPAMQALMNLYPSGNDPELGFDGGLNSTGYIFNAPINTSNNLYTARLDFKLANNHSLFWRGNLAGIDTDITPAEFPGLPPNNKFLNNSRGMAISYTGIFKPNLINTAEWGFIRQGVSQTGGTSVSLTSENFSDPLNFTRGFARTVPTQELRDDITWTHRRHTIQVGADMQFPRNHFLTYQNSYPTFILGDFAYCSNDCRDPINKLEAEGQQAPSDFTSFLTSFMELTGTISEASAAFPVNPKTGQVLTPDGQPVLRHYAENDFEWYAQDSFRVKPNLTLNFGLRYSYFGVPWEQNGLQTIPNMSLAQWFAIRVADMNAGTPADASPLLSFIPGGKANDKPSWYGPSTRNFSPRLSLAYSPGSQSGILGRIFGGPGRSSIRLGFGMYYDRVGGAIATDQVINGGDPGLVDTEGTPVGLYSYATAPRFSGICSVSAGCSGLPSLSSLLPFTPTKGSFPFTPDTGIDNFNFAVSSNLKTPYSYDMDFSVERDIGKGFTIEGAYVGNLGHRLLLKKDYGQFLGEFKDTQSGQTLWQAYNLLIKQMGSLTNQAPPSKITPIAWMQDLMPNMPAYAATYLGNPAIAKLTPTQAFYAIVQGYAPDWSDAVLAMDDPAPGTGSPWSLRVDPQQDGRVVFGPQFDSIPAWTSEGTSSFNSLQLSIRKKAGPLIIDVNYVYSKSLDDASAAENADLFLNEGQVNGQIPNAFNVRAGRAVSDFDLKHNFNADWVYELPIGNGRRFDSNPSKVVGALINNWQFTGTIRNHSGFPLTPRDGFNYPTNDFQPGPATIIGPLTSSVTKSDPNGFPNLFSNPQQAYTELAFTLPGSPGSRNEIFGPAYFVTDLGLAKWFVMPWNDKQRLQFRFEAFNAFNNVNFGSTAGQFSSTYAGATSPIDGFDVSTPGVFGRLYSTAGPLGGAREVQVGLRFDF
jgi:Carboxypeptidase regulatory-like domain